jgi:hypothetical protein
MAFKATVYKSRTCKGLVGYGDANPDAEMRVAETRAVRPGSEDRNLGVQGSLIAMRVY